jgi:endonuclease/exonuclease/phosphatase (EEP) superfamily protein YafD
MGRSRPAGRERDFEMRRPALRILSANLANGKADADAFAELVEAVEPDVVTVQELVPLQADALARALPFGKLEPRLDHSGMGIALRSPGSVRSFPLPYRSGFLADVPGPNDESIEILNIHLAAPHVPPIFQRVLDRRGQVRDILAHVEAMPRRRRVLAGDLNATPMWRAYRRLQARFDDAAVQAARRHGREPGRTWGPWPGSPRLLRIDHVLVQGLVATVSRVLPLRGGDHSALVVDLDLRPG